MKRPQKRGIEASTFENINRGIVVVATQIDRCRLTLIANPQSASQEKIKSAVKDGVIACCIIYQNDTGDSDFLKYCQDVVPVLQEHDVAVLIADDTRTAGRCGADGIYIEKNRGQVREFSDQYMPDLMVGCGGYKDRHGALEAGEAKPDFVLFGKLGGDIRPEAHPKNVAMATWWAEFIEIPCIVLAGTDIQSIVDCAKTGADFVAVEGYVFSGQHAPEVAVALAEEQLEQHAPRFEEVEA